MPEESPERNYGDLHLSGKSAKIIAKMHARVYIVRDDTSGILLALCLAKEYLCSLRFFNRINREW